MKADFNIDHQWYEAIQVADVIKLTDGTEFVKKEVASKIMAEYASLERNKTIDECIDNLYDVDYGYSDTIWEIVKQRLESLKIKP